MRSSQPDPSRTSLQSPQRDPTARRSEDSERAAERTGTDGERSRSETAPQPPQQLERLGVLAGGLSHDFNNLLMTILGSADLALQDLEPDAPLRAHVERIRRAARRAADLTDQLLAYSGQGPIHDEPIDLSSLVRDCLASIRGSLPSRAKVQYDLTSKLPRIDGDAAHLVQVITNLVTNAAEALRDGAGNIWLRSRVRDVKRRELALAHGGESFSEGPCVILEVADDGIGMSDELRSKIFDPFFSTKRSGRGLGLASVMGIVTAHRGAIQVDSQPGRGTLVRVLFPCSGLEGASVPAPKRSTRPARRQARILLADDEEEVREVTGEMLRRLGVTVVSAANGAEALRLFAAQPEEIDAALLDVTMPELSGPDAAIELWRLRPDTPIILMSGYSQARLAKRARELALKGADFLQKPFAPEALEAAVNRALPGGLPK